MSFKTVPEYKSLFLKKLDSIYPAEEIDAIFRLVVEQVFNEQYLSVVTNRNIALSTKQSDVLKEILDQLFLKKPIQYILNKAYFYELELEVSPYVLIPRQETELLVHTLIEKLKSKLDPKILDIGTGSGCIAISLKKHIPKAHVTAVDVSENALKVAEQNARTNNLDVRFINDDILHPLFKDYGNYDLIVSNPPYVRESEKKQMHDNVLAFEPELALFVEDKNPLIFYDTISSFAESRLKKGGILAFEINEAFGRETIDTVLKYSFSDPELISDLNGKDRIVVAKRK